ncbi:hypothetical protein DY023_01920 [Microbacterium bovistercoris]|uniref:Alpha-1,2-fucosyltransferase n=1 Tax=Microbacterium bovistercoris TaxID=2293570 RepID=A0A371NXN0_9MICO|nr:alpha-1,2-fucosyltransferase [Microbacterium bovistercoris]REJ08046.1 hypothetical protein DY023_01920 [Microbacterium bovistercoris]
MLYYWLHAFAQRSRGIDCLSLEVAHSAEWIDYFPTMASLNVKRSEVRLADRRVVPGPLQTFGMDFTSAELDAFIELHLLDSRSMLTQMTSPLQGLYDLTINVRRGDYYSVPKWRGEYSFDVVEYVRSALEQVSAQRPIDRIHVVSDDPEWCRIKLGWLGDVAPVSSPPDNGTPLDHLAALTASPRLILANSTFSYWGGYLSEWLHRGGEQPHPKSEIWAPAFHNRFFPDGGRATQLHPNWHVIENIPGGWDG